MPHRYDITNELVFDLYFNQGFNRRQTAEKLNCSLDLIDYRLKKMGLLHKSMSDCVEAGKKRLVPISQELMARLDGEMLGDGHIYVNKRQGSFRESFGFDKIEWAEWLCEIFKNVNIPLVGKGICFKKPSGKSKNPTWSFCTVETIELGEIQKRWYRLNPNFNPNKPRCFSNRRYIKIVPKDLKLTPLAMLHWFIGDGTVGEFGGSNLCTEGFTQDEVEFLRLRLQEDLNILSSRRCRNMIGLVRAEHEKMLEIIGECPVDCYKYKWMTPTTAWRHYRKYDHSINAELINSFLIKD